MVASRHISYLKKSDEHEVMSHLRYNFVLLLSIGVRIFCTIDVIGTYIMFGSPWYRDTSEVVQRVRVSNFIVSTARIGSQNWSLYFFLQASEDDAKNLLYIVNS